MRGYKYQSVGPQFPDHNPQGGTAVTAGTVEFRQRILSSYGVAVFADAGQVTANGPPFTGKLARGRRRGCALLHADRADPAGRRVSVEPPAGRRLVRALYRDRTGLLMRRALKWIGWIVAVLIGLPLALLVAVILFANTEPGPRL